MKKLFLILIPIFMLIAVFFYFTGQEFNFNVFLDVISEWNFSNSYDLILEIKEEFESSLHILDVGNKYDSLGLITEGIFGLLKSFISLPLSMVRVLISYIVELVSNVGNVLGYLLGW